MKIYTLYVGSNGNGQPTREVLIEMVGVRFESFTLLPGQGVFRGTAEPVWLVQLASDDVERVLAMGEQLRAHFDQDGVGVEHAGNYFRCTAADPASGLRQLLGEER